MKKTNSNLIGINMLFVVALVISNVVTAKLFATGINIFGIALTLPGAALCYAITFLATDVIGEIWGKAEANRTVRWGFVGHTIGYGIFYEIIGRNRSQFKVSRRIYNQRFTNICIVCTDTLGNINLSRICVINVCLTGDDLVRVCGG